MSALILVDVQNDFTPAAGSKPAGALAVADGNAVVAVANALMDHFDPVVATQDWHPVNHRSFVSQHPGCRPFDVIELDGKEQVLWPVHCVQDTWGAKLVTALNIDHVDHVVRKGVDAAIDSYSGFFDNHRRRATGLADYLESHDVKDVAVMGLATDVCVKFTVLDSLALGLKTRVIVDGCRGVNVRPNDSDDALKQMRKAGAELVNAADVA